MLTMEGTWHTGFGINIPRNGEVLGERLYVLIKHPKRIEPWFVNGRTILILKDGCEGKPQQFKPITCLNIMHKLFTTIMTELRYGHATQIGAIHHEQRALVRGKRGCLDALHIDYMAAQIAKKKTKTDLSVAYINYQKIFDKVPHQQILGMLNSIKAPEESLNAQHTYLCGAQALAWEKDRKHRGLMCATKRGYSKGIPCCRSYSAQPLDLYHIG